MDKAEDLMARLTPMITATILSQLKTCRLDEDACDTPFSELDSSTTFPAVTTRRRLSLPTPDPLQPSTPHLGLTIHEQLEMILETMTKIQKDLSAVKYRQEEIHRNNQSMTIKLDKLAERIDTLETKQNENDAKCAELTDIVYDLEDELDEVHTRLDETSPTSPRLVELENRLEDLEQRHRMENLEFHGIPEIEGEDCRELVAKMARFVNVDISAKDISIAHRLPATKNKTPGIIARFTSRTIRNQIYSKRIQLSKVTNFRIPGMRNLFINENLTRTKKDLYYQVRRKKVQQSYKSAWTNNAQIYVQKSDRSQPLKITSYDDIQKIR